MYVMMFGGHGPFIRASGEVDFKALFAGAVNFREKVDLLGLKVGIGRLRFSDGARNFCQRLLQCNPRHRPTAPEAIADPWFAAVVPTESRKTGPIKVQGPIKESNFAMPSKWGAAMSEMSIRTNSGIEIATEVSAVLPVNYRICKSGASVPSMPRAKKSSRSGAILHESDWARSLDDAEDAVILTELWDQRHASNSPLTLSTAWYESGGTIPGETLNRKIHCFI